VTIPHLAVKKRKPQTRNKQQTRRSGMQMYNTRQILVLKSVIKIKQA
jgi:hypothetical protein